MIVDQKQKSVSTTAGMEAVATSPFWPLRILGIDARLTRVENALQIKDFNMLGETIEEDCISMHAVAITQKPSLFYWSEATIECIRAVIRWRKAGLPVFFTIDAGPNVHLICEGRNEKHVTDGLKETSHIQSVLVNKPSAGARIVDAHLF